MLWRAIRLKSNVWIACFQIELSVDQRVSRAQRHWAGIYWRTFSLVGDPSVCSISIGSVFFLVLFCISLSLGEKGEAFYFRDLNYDEKMRQHYIGLGETRCKYDAKQACMCKKLSLTVHTLAHFILIHHACTHDFVICFVASRKQVCGGVGSCGCAAR